jgi:hypothetical protein
VEMMFIACIKMLEVSGVTLLLVEMMWIVSGG